MDKIDKSVTKPLRKKLPNLLIYHRGAYVDKYNKSLVYIIVYYNNKRLSFNTGVAVEAKFWDEEHKRVVSSLPESSDLNLIIQNSIAKLNNIFVKYRLQDKELTPDILRDEYKRPSKLFDFTEWMETAIEERRGEVTDTSIRQFRAHLAKLKAYKKPIAFAELNEDFFYNFNRYLKTTLKNEANTRFNTIKTIRTFINIARRKGLMDHNPLQRMPVKRASSDRVFLTEEELQHLFEIYKSKFLPAKYHKVLRHFLFSCFTGLRISDIREVTMEDIIGDFITIIPVKTKNVNKKVVRIPLTKPAWKLINDESPNKMYGRIFNMYSENTTREYLRDVMQYAKIQKHVTFHSGRHTFATVFLRRTRNIAALQKILGHSTISQTMEYAHILTEDLTKEMAFLNEF